MEASEYFEKSEYSKIDFGSNPRLFSKKELIDFADECQDKVKIKLL